MFIWGGAMVGLLHESLTLPKTPGMLVVIVTI
jgi:hypothetical protein